MLTKLKKKIYLYFFNKLNSSLEKELINVYVDEVRFKVKYKFHFFYLQLLNPKFFNKYLYQKCLLLKIKTFYRGELTIAKDIEYINVLINNPNELNKLKGAFKYVKLSDYLFSESNVIFNIKKLKNKHSFLLKNIIDINNLSNENKANFYSIYNELFNTLKILIEISLN